MSGDEGLSLLWALRLAHKESVAVELRHREERENVYQALRALIDENKIKLDKEPLIKTVFELTEALVKQFAKVRAANLELMMVLGKVQKELAEKKEPQQQSGSEKVVAAAAA